MSRARFFSFQTHTHTPSQRGRVHTAIRCIDEDAGIKENPQSEQTWRADETPPLCYLQENNIF